MAALSGAVEAATLSGLPAILIIAPGALSSSSRTFKQLASLRIVALPIRAFGLDPVTARAAGVARCPALGNDALEPEPVAVVEEGLAIWKTLHLFEEWRVRLSAQSIEVALALGW